MANEFNEGEGIGTQHEAAPDVEAGLRDESEIRHEEEANDTDSSAATWVKDVQEWLTTSIRDRPLGALLVIAGASLVTGVVTGMLLRSPQE